MAVGLMRAAGRMIAKGTRKVGGAGNILNGGMSAWIEYEGYKSAREEGNGVAYLMEAVLPIMLSGPQYLAYMAVKELSGAAVSAAESYGQYSRSLAKQSGQAPFQNSQFAETQQTFTMRQAGMALAQKSKYSLQQTMLGNEAQYMHR